MTRAGAAGRLARAAAVGGGGLSLLGASLYTLLRVEVVLARLRIGDARVEPPDPTGRYGSGDGEPIRLAVIGDSAAAGYGAETGDETFGGYLARGLTLLTGRPVDLSAYAVVGAQTAQLTDQIETAFAVPAVRRPQVVAAIIGVNDVTHRIRPANSLESLRLAVRQTRAEGAHVVLGTCPDLGTVRPIVPPLRQVARRWSRRLAAAQTVVVVEEGGRSVSLGELLGPDFEREPTVMFGPDRFHPSPAGYRAAALAMLPSVADVLGLLPADGAEPEPLRAQVVYGLGRAAAVAAERPGTEVAPQPPTHAPERAGSASRRRGPLLARVRRARGAQDDATLAEKPREGVVSAAPIGQAQGTDAPSTRR